MLIPNFHLEKRSSLANRVGLFTEPGRRLQYAKKYEWALGLVRVPNHFPFTVRAPFFTPYQRLAELRSEINIPSSPDSLPM